MPLNIGYYYSKPWYLPEMRDEDLSYSSLRMLEVALRKRDANLFMVSGKDSYVGKRRFKKSWRFDTNFGLTPHRSIDLDVLLSAWLFMPQSQLKIINHPELHRLCRDKYLAERMFPDYHAKTVLLHTPGDLEAAVEASQAERLVLKSTVSSHSRDVRIGSGEYLLANQVPYPAVLEEFLDSSVGIAGITPGYHDMRVIMIEHVPSLVLVRVPAPGELRAGIEFGATTLFPDMSELPAEVRELIRHIDSQFTVYPGRVYSIDMAMTADGPKIIELNKAPALWSASQHPNVEQFIERLADHLVAYANSD